MAKKRKNLIGIFDSGFGGLHIAKSIIRVLPNYNFIYLGDTARVPYGHRSPKEVLKFTTQATSFLFQKKCALIVLACNTSSSEALRKIQQNYLPKYYPSRRVLGVIIPATEESAVQTKNHRIGVMATTGTVASKTFVRELKKLNPQIKVFQKACPRLVPLIENGKHNSLELKIVLKKYIKPLLSYKIDTLILGCTHYGLIEKEIKKIVGPKVKIISEANIVAKKLKNYLKRHPEIETSLIKNHQKTFYATGDIKKFENFGSQFFGQKIKAKKTKIN